MSEIQYKILHIIMTLLLLVSIVFLAREAAEYVGGERLEVKSEKICVVLNPGHGGADPGKVGIDGSLEKDINLAIAKQVREFLEANDIEVVMTREHDEGLYQKNASNKKVQDMKKRIELIEKAEPAITVSIHQNSYGEEYVHGAQVFYYTDSKEGKELAQILQKSLVIRADRENTRETKANNSYYLLKKTKTPIVIVECGFLSNQREAKNLNDKEYQGKIAWAISMGIMQYLNQS